MRPTFISMKNKHWNQMLDKSKGFFKIIFGGFFLGISICEPSCIVRFFWKRLLLIF
jgi:hypothetical protein